jgi:NADPH:quinone reductase
LYNDILKAIVEEITNNDDSVAKPTRVQPNNKIKSTLTDVLSPINSENLHKAHKKLELGTTIGKIDLSGF